MLANAIGDKELLMPENYNPAALETLLGAS